ncbi:MAG TPA: hypothetical protein VMA30_22800 [Xanthobacteraceae bacterium]|nr:hypothetical protein [Xanthobacteraceae bacterium]
MRALSIASATTIVLLIVPCPAWPDDVPALNVDPVCHGIARQAAGPGEKGDPDLAFAQCVKNEQSMRTRLVGEWSTFTPSERLNCVNEQTSGSLPSYTDLVTCLEMARTARQLDSPAPAQQNK